MSELCASSSKADGERQTGVMNQRESCVKVVDEVDAK